MPDVFQYNSGSLMAALDPAKNMVPLTGEAFMAQPRPIPSSPSVTSGQPALRRAAGQAMGGGILYNKKVFAD